MIGFIIAICALLIAETRYGDADTGCAIAAILLFVSFLAAWITHVISTIQSEEFLLLLVGAIFFPIGIIHGFGIWFGVF